MSAFVQKHHVPDSNSRIKGIGMKYLALLLSHPNTWNHSTISLPLVHFHPSRKAQKSPFCPQSFTPTVPRLPPASSVYIKLKLKFCSVPRLSSSAQSEQSRAAKSCKVKGPPLPVSVCSATSSEEGTKESPWAQQGVTMLLTELRLSVSFTQTKKVSQPISAGQH